jgi:precorrin-6Y C5,15-methyltransferase (decarboxylating)
VFGGERHLKLAGIDGRGRTWPVPFETTCVLAQRGRPTAVLASGDPFWHGAGGTLASQLVREEWIAHPSPSTFSLAASRLGWPLEATICIALHAAPFERLVPLLARGARVICLVRDGKAAGDLAEWLAARGWGASRLWMLAALGGPRERIVESRASDDVVDVAGPLAVAIEADGAAGLPRASGLPDDLFRHDGQITKRPMRALALSALAPRPGERLWDIGAGSGSISIEWALAGGAATAIETKTDRAANIRANADAFGLAHRIKVMTAAAPEALFGLEKPDAIFVGGGLDAAMFDAIWSLMSDGTRIVAHAVTLETEALLAMFQQTHGGDLLRIELSHAAPLGRYKSWQASRPVVQWSAVKGAGA